LNRRPSRAVAFCTALAITLAAGAALAQRIVLVRPASTDPTLLSAFAHLQGELAIHGFEVALVDATGTAASPDDLNRAAEHDDAVAAIALLRSKDAATADIWISDRVTGKISRRTISTAPGPEGPNMLAVRAVDLLRASLREFGPLSKAPADVVGADRTRAPARVLEWAAPPSLPGFTLEAGVVAQATPSGFAPGYGPSIGLSYVLVPRLLLGLLFQVPLFGARFVTEGATATLVQEQLMAEVGWRFWTGDALSCTVLVDAGVHHLAVQGTAVAPYRPESDTAWTGLGGVGVGADWRFAPPAALSVRARSLVLVPRPVVDVGADRISFRRPLFQVAGGLDVSF
jgi:hypothetical protein